MESRLPKFYLNLDRNLFFHTDWQREFENQLPDNWKGKASSQFWSLIPDSYQYWIINGMNFGNYMVSITIFIDKRVML